MTMRARSLICHALNYCCIASVDPKTKVLGGDFILFIYYSFYFYFFKGQKGGGEVILFLLFLKEGGQRSKRPLFGEK